MDRHQVIGFSSRFGKPPLQKLVKRFQVLQPPVLPRPHFAQIATELDKAGIFLRLFALLPSQDLIDLGEHEPSPLAVQLGRSEEHTSELQSRFDLVCRLLLEKKTINSHTHMCLKNKTQYHQYKHIIQTL